MSDMDDLTEDEELELRGLWMSRRMFGWMTGIPEMYEERTYEQFVEETTASARDDLRRTA